MLDTIKHALEAAGATVARAKDFGHLVIADVGDGLLWITDVPELEGEALGAVLLEGERLDLDAVFARTAETIAWDSRMNRIRVWLGIAAE